MGYVALAAFVYIYISFDGASSAKIENEVGKI